MLAPSVAKPQRATAGPAGRQAAPGGARRAAQRPARGLAEQVLTLQRSIGNQATTRLLTQGAAGAGRATPDGRRGQAARAAAGRMRPEAAAPALLARGLLRARLELGATNDPLEREAEATALRVMRMSAGGGACCASCAAGGGCEGETPTLRRAPADGGAGTPAVALPPALEGQVRRLARGGEPLPPAVRAGFEPRFGADLSGVRIHRDAEAASASRAIGARAFALGNHIGFGAGQWAPGTPAGDHLIAHELAHTLQGGGGAAGGVRRYSWDEFVDDVTEVGGGAIDAVKEVGGKVAEVAEEVGGEVAEVAGDVGERVVEVAKDVAETAEEVGGQVSEVAQEVLDAVAEFGQEVVDAAAWVVTEAGKLALRGANAVAGMLGGSVTVGPDGLVIELPQIPLFDRWERTLVPPLPRRFIYLAAAGAELGPMLLIGGIGIPLSAPAIRVFLGPGRLQNIRVRIDPTASTYEAHGEIYVGAALNEWMQTGLAARVDALTALPTEPPLPVEVSAEAGGLLTLQGSGVGSISNALTLSYSAGAIGFSINPALELGVIMEADLHAYLNAQLYDIELCEYLWPIRHWQVGEAYRFTFPLSLGSAGGAVTITLGPPGMAPIPVDAIETNLQRYVPESKGCKPLEAIVAELCEREILPPELCEREGDVEPLRKMLALAICKCQGPSPCGRYFYKCFTVDDTICGKHGPMMKEAQRLCNHDSEYNAHCRPEKGCDRHHYDWDCPVKENRCKDGYFGGAVKEETEEDLCAAGLLPPEECGGVSAHTEKCSNYGPYLVTTPTGNVTIPAGAKFFAGQTIGYGQGSNKHTRLAIYTPGEMEGVRAKRDRSHALWDPHHCAFCAAWDRFKQGGGDLAYGSQLSKDCVGAATYEQMIIDACVSGQRTEGTNWIRHHRSGAGYSLVRTRGPTSIYHLFVKELGASVNAHIFPGMP